MSRCRVLWLVLVDERCILPLHTVERFCRFKFSPHCRCPVVAASAVRAVMPVLLTCARPLRRRATRRWALVFVLVVFHVLREHNARIPAGSSALH